MNDDTIAELLETWSCGNRKDVAAALMSKPKKQALIGAMALARQLRAEDAQNLALLIAVGPDGDIGA